MEACMPVVALTPAFIATKLQCPEGQRHIEFCDTQVRGLFIDVSTGASGQTVTWNFRFKENGKTKMRRLGRLEDITLDDARKQVALLKAEHALGRHEAKQELETGITLGRFWRDNYLPHASEYKRSIGRDKQLYKRIEPQFGHVLMKEITRLQVQQFQRKLSAESLSAATVNQHLQLMRRLFNLGVEWQFLDRNVLSRIKLLHVDNRRETFLTEAQIEDLVEVIKTDDNRLVCMIILFLLSTGARVGEALSVEWEHIDFENAMWKIPASNSKSKRQKHLPLSESALWALKAVERKDDSPFVFASPVTGKAFTGIRRTWYKLRRNAGLPSNIRIHDLRHTFASRLVSAGESLYVVQQMLGHADPRTSQRYAHLSMDAQRRAARLVSIPMA
jgi:integrase